MFLVWWERKVAAHYAGTAGANGCRRLARMGADYRRRHQTSFKRNVYPDGRRHVGVSISTRHCFSAGVFVVRAAAVRKRSDRFGFGCRSFVRAGDFGSLHHRRSHGRLGINPANKFSMLGELRAAAQVVSFEIPRILSIVPVVMWAGTLSLNGKLFAHTEATPLAGVFPRWFIFLSGGRPDQLPYLSHHDDRGDQSRAVRHSRGGIRVGRGIPHRIRRNAVRDLFSFGIRLRVRRFAVGKRSFLWAAERRRFPFLRFIPSWGMAEWSKPSGLFSFSSGLVGRYFRGSEVDRVMDLCWKIFLPWTIINIVLAGAAILWRVR